MTDNQFKIMEYLMRCNSQEKKKFIDKYLIQQYGRDRCVITKDYTIAFGDIPIGLISHVDTVFEETKKYKKYINLYYDEKRHTMVCPGSPGFDDSAGCFCLIEIIRRNFRPTIILCEGEEMGVLGGQKMVKDIPICPIELKYIIELDRQGKNDCVFYGCDNPEFENYIETFGFITDLGSYSDISIIGPAWGIACANLSCGYFNEHTYFEILRVDFLFETINKVEQMLKNADSAPKFAYIPEAIK